MEKRYYYTERLAAAWMSKHYGMKFEGGTISAFDCSVFSDGIKTPHYYADNGDDNFKGVIYPDSLQLLEPQKGDLIHIVRGFCSYYKTVADIATGGGKSATGIWSDGEHWDITTKEPLHDWEIIQRGGKSFHWPEYEE